MDLVFAVVFGGVAVAALLWFIRYAVSVRRGNYRHSSKGTKWFVPGQGTHGSPGGQSPPIVPNNPEWDPDRRIG